MSKLSYRDDAICSHAAARAIAAHGFKAYQPDPRDEDGEGELKALLKRAAAVLHSKAKGANDGR